MNRYDSYKNSGVEWLGEIPSHWEVSTLGKILLPVSEKNRPDLPLLSITRELGVIERNMEDQESNHNFIPDDLSNYKVLRKGQFGMNKMKAWQGSYGVSNFTGIVSPAYYIFNFIKSVNSEFFHWAIRSKIYVSFFASASDGVRIGQWDLSKDRMKSIPFVIPSESEQQKISQYLDNKTAKIDQAIMLEEKQIELLKEHKQTLIQNAVTKGLNPQVKFKDSGVEWLGEVPEHWELTIGMNVFKENKRDNKGMKESTVLSLSYGQIIIKPKEKLVGLVPESFETYQIVEPNDIIIRCTDLQNDQTSLRTGLAKDKGIITSAYLNLKVINNYSAKFLHYYLHTLDITKVLYKFGSGLRQNLSFLDFRRLPVVDIPLEEQHQIANYLDQQTAKVDHAIQLKQQQIDKLKEYKMVLINDVVTGKVKVA